MRTPILIQPLVAVLAAALISSLAVSLTRATGNWIELPFKSRSAVKSSISEAMSETSADPLEIIKLGRERLLELRRQREASGATAEEKKPDKSGSKDKKRKKKKKKKQKEKQQREANFSQPPNVRAESDIPPSGTPNKEPLIEPQAVLAEDRSKAFRVLEETVMKSEAVEPNQVMLTDDSHPQSPPEAHTMIKETHEQAEMPILSESHPDMVHDEELKGDEEEEEHGELELERPISPYENPNMGNEPRALDEHHTLEHYERQVPALHEHRGPENYERQQPALDSKPVRPMDTQDGIIPLPSSPPPLPPADIPMPGQHEDMGFRHSDLPAPTPEQFLPHRQPHPHPLSPPHPHPHPHSQPQPQPQPYQQTDYLNPSPVPAPHWTPEEDAMNNFSNLPGHGSSLPEVEPHRKHRPRAKDYDFEREYIDDRDPSNPYYVHLKQRDRQHRDRFGGSREREQSSSAYSLKNPRSFRHRFASSKSSYSGDPRKFYNGQNSWQNDALRGQPLYTPVTPLAPLAPLATFSHVTPVIYNTGAVSMASAHAWPTYHTYDSPVGYSQQPGYYASAYASAYPGSPTPYFHLEDEMQGYQSKKQARRHRYKANKRARKAAALAASAAVHVH